MDSHEMNFVANGRDQHFNERQLPSRDNDHHHVWVVFSTALADGWLMLQCVDCGLHGTVEDPTSEEWGEAFHAPSRPFQWIDETRVVIKPEVRLAHKSVVRTEGSKKCECYEQRGVIKPQGFERFPNELTRPSINMTDADRKELVDMAETVRHGVLCSYLFEYFLKCFQRDTGHQSGNAVRTMARRISALDRKGLHCSPSVVARLLTDIAASPKPTQGDA